MTTKRVQAKRTKAKPVEREIRRAAARASIKPAAPTNALTPEDKALLADSCNLTGRSTLAEDLMLHARSSGSDSHEIAVELRREARAFEHIAEKLTPNRETRDTMLADALEVISAAEAIYYVNGLHGSDPIAIMTEALHSAEQELDMFSGFVESSDSEIHWQELWRARDRVRLARKLADFRRTHGVYQPQKANGAEMERAS